jgi:putative ABC transport system ATP-binding protein
MEHLFELSEVSRCFIKGGEVIRAVDQVSLRIQVGDFVVIQGQSGSGKTTLLNLMGTLDLPSKGQLLFWGRDVARLKDRELSRLRQKQIGLVFQSFNLIPEMNALENVAMPMKYAGVEKRERERRAKETLMSVGMAHRLNHTPAELSGGEEQRVAIARALVNNPDVILADEPTGNLDTQNRDALLNLFKGLNSRGQTIVVVTHDAAVAQAAKRCLQMQDGRIYADSE